MLGGGALSLATGTPSWAQRDAVLKDRHLGTEEEETGPLTC